VCKSSVVSGKRKPLHLQHRIGSCCEFSLMPIETVLNRGGNGLPDRSREGNLQRGDTPVLSHEVRSEVSCYQTTMPLPIRFHGRHGREDSLNENVPGCRTFVQSGLCAVIDSGF
jgi:hypothetical protein